MKRQLFIGLLLLAGSVTSWAQGLKDAYKDYFLIGVAVSYLFVFPLTVRFLGTYSVSDQVGNMLTLQSYMDTLITMSLVLGLVFELPVVCWILGRMGILTRPVMREYRRHAVIVILVIAAIITPTTDAFTLTLVALPIWLLYEGSILLVPKGVR
jgi:sec-independent protein translocase protein TatC